jgi:hypothetical protein
MPILSQTAAPHPRAADALLVGDDDDDDDTKRHHDTRAVRSTAHLI